MRARALPHFCRNYHSVDHNRLCYLVCLCLYYYVFVSLCTQAPFVFGLVWSPIGAMSHSVMIERMLTFIRFHCKESHLLMSREHSNFCSFRFDGSFGQDASTQQQDPSRMTRTVLTLGRTGRQDVWSAVTSEGECERSSRSRWGLIASVFVSLMQLPNMFYPSTTNVNACPYLYQCCVLVFVIDASRLLKLRANQVCYLYGSGSWYPTQLPTVCILSAHRNGCTSPTLVN